MKKVQLDKKCKNYVGNTSLKESICDNDRTNPLFSSINVIYEENKNLDISQLELESDRLMESIAQMDAKNQDRKKSQDEKRLS